MTTIAPKPNWAPAVWKDSRGSIFAQFGQDVLRFEATEGGLGKLLKLIPTIEGQPGYISGKQNVADHVLRKPIKIAMETERKRVLRNLTPERRQRLKDLIRKSGIKESK
jgi:hypothetical protein